MQSQPAHLINEYPLSGKTLISTMFPNPTNVSLINASVRPVMQPPRYTVQFVGLD